MKKNKYIYCEYKNKICYIVLDRNPANSMNGFFVEELCSVVAEVEKNLSNLKAVFIHGSGRHFSSGAELDDIKKYIIKDRFPNIKKNKWGQNVYRSSRCFMKLNSFSVPVIALVRGVCIGSGLELALAAHIRIAEENSILGLPEISWNLIPGCGGTLMFPEAAGYDQAKRYILTGEMLTSQEGLKIGIIDKVVAKGKGFTAGKELADKIAGYSMKLLKNLIYLIHYN